MWRIRLIFMLGVFILAGCNLGQEPAVPTPIPPTETPVLSCDQLVTTALETAADACGNVGRNQACYGNRLIHAQFAQDATVPFDKTGDITDLFSIHSLTTAPLDETSQVWGIAVLKVQADLPDTLPGQNVTMLLYGDVAMDNISPDMKAVTFNTGITSTTCASAPKSALMIQSPEGTEATLNINGATVTLGSTLYMTAYIGDEMTIATIEGEAIVTADNQTQIAQAGAQVRMPLGGTNNLEVVGPPSAPEPFDVQTISQAPIPLLERNVAVGPAITTSSSPAATNTSRPNPVVPTAIIPCTPRTDWTITYTVQSGDTLFSIAGRYGITLDELQLGNCISNPNQLTVGQVIRVPFQLATNVPPTNTPAIVATATPSNPNLRADDTTLASGECTTIRWDVFNITAVYFEGQPTVGSSTQQVCPQRSTTYTLLVVHPDGQQVPYTVRIDVAQPTATEDPIK